MTRKVGDTVYGPNGGPPLVIVEVGETHYVVEDRTRYHRAMLAREHVVDASGDEACTCKPTARDLLCATHGDAPELDKQE